MPVLGRPLGFHVGPRGGYGRGPFIGRASDGAKVRGLLDRRKVELVDGHTHNLDCRPGTTSVEVLADP